MHRNGSLSDRLYVYYSEPLFYALVVFLNEWTHFKKMYIKNDFKLCKSVHHHTIQINQPTRCKISHVY